MKYTPLGKALKDRAINRNAFARKLGISEGKFMTYCTTAKYGRTPPYSVIRAAAAELKVSMEEIAPL